MRRARGPRSARRSPTSSASNFGGEATGCLRHFEALRIIRAVLGGERSRSSVRIPVRHRVYEQAVKAIQEHKWLQSEKAGRDVGPQAALEWNQRYWLRFYRERFVQHLRGEVFFEEFGIECYRLVAGGIAASREVLDTVLDKVQEGAENLELICWARRHRLPRDQVLEILKALNINNRRLPPPRIE